MASRKPGPGSPEGARRNAEQIAGEHARLHKGEPGKVAGPMKVTHPSVPGRPDPSGPAYREGEFDPAREAQRGS